MSSPLLAPATAPHDLRAFFRAVGKFRGQRALLATPEERLEADTPVVLLDDTISRINVTAIPVVGFVDGIQNSLCVTFRGHRPVFLSYVAAGAVGPGAHPIGLREKLAVICSSLDREWVDSLGSSIPVEELAVESPPEVERDALRLLAADRESAERGLIADLHDTVLDSPGPGVLIVDGSLLARPVNPRIVGVVKSARRKYLADESVLYGLAPGWRSPRFTITAGSAGNSVERYSCYLRLHDASDQSWAFGLIRLETFDPDLLDPLAARCLAERQLAGSGDGRWDRHLASVAAVERFLRSRRPAVFSVVS